MGLAIGVAIVVGLIAPRPSRPAASSLLLFVAILLASALEPMVGTHPRPLPARARRDDPGRLRHVLRDRRWASPSSSCRSRDQPGPGDRRQPAGVLRFGPVVGSDAPPGDPRAIGHRARRLGREHRSSQSTTPDPDQVVEVGATAAEAAVSLATLLTIVYFWLVEHARLQRYLLAFIPAERRAGARDAWNEIETRLGLWVRGQLILMGTMGVATGIAYTLLGLPGALLLGADRGPRRSDPDHRPAARGDPGGPRRGDRVTRAGAHRRRRLHRHPARRGQRPRPDGHAQHDRLSPLLVLLSLLVGAAVGGLVGAFLAVPIVASIEIVLARLQARETSGRPGPGRDRDPRRGDASTSTSGRSPMPGDGLGAFPG